MKLYRCYFAALATFVGSFASLSSLYPYTHLDQRRRAGVIFFFWIRTG
jgi:hypothetical protein